MKGYFKIGLLLVFSIFCLVACGDDSQTSSSNDSTESKELVVVDWGGAGQEAAKKTIYAAFEKEFGVKVTAVSPPDSGKLKTMVESGNVEWDVVSEEAGIALRLAKEGLFEELDFDVIDTENINPEMVTDYTIGHQIYNLNIAYNTEVFGDDHPKNWAEFWDTVKYPGPRALATEVFGLMEIALLADGVKTDELYPLDIDRAFKSLDKIKDHVKVWWDAGAQPPQLLASKDVVVSSAWNGRISAAKDEGANVENEFNQAAISYTSWAVPKGSPNKDLAMEFINFALQAEQQAEYSKIIDYSPTNQKALALLPEDVLERLGQKEDEKKDQFIINAEYWSEHFEEVNERFNKWLLE